MAPFFKASRQPDGFTRAVYPFVGAVAKSRRTEGANCGLKYGTATRFMAVICHGNPANRVLGTAFDNYADAMTRQWATALIPNTSHGDTVDREPGRADTDHRPAMRGWITEANDVGHT